MKRSHCAQHTKEAMVGKDYHSGALSKGGCLRLGFAGQAFETMPQ